MNKPIVVSHYICSGCQQPIIDPNDGLHFAGNVTLADPNTGRGIIGGGEWLRKIEKGERLFHDDVPENVFHKLCFCKLVDIKVTNVR